MALLSSSILAFYLIFFFSLFSTTTLAQNSPKDFLDPHNTARADVNVDPISWDDAVAAYAQNFASQLAADCHLAHSGGTYGENIYWAWGDGTAADAVNYWVAEKQYYDYESNSCSAPPNESCYHYTQVVWAKSVQLGCAAVTCSNGGGTIIVCNYNPPGNYNNERPY